MTEKLNVLGRTKQVLGIITASIIIITCVWYVVVDRFEVIAQVKENTERVESLERQIININTNNQALYDIKFNLKRLLEKQGMKWEPLDK